MSLFFFSLSLIFTLWSAGRAKFTLLQIFLLFFFGLLSQGLVSWLRSDNPFVSQNPREIYSSHSLDHLVVWSNLNSSHNSQWITLPTHLCQVFYSFCASLQHSLTVLVIISSLSHINYTHYSVTPYRFSF